MRIAYFSDNFFPEISGITDTVITTGEMLRSKGHEVVYVAPWFPAREFAKIKPKNGAESKTHDYRLDLPIFRLPSLPFPNSPTGQSRLTIPLGTSIPYLRKFRPDVIHAQAPFGSGIEAWLASRVLGVPLVGTNHTPIEEFIKYSPLRGRWGALFARRYFAWFYNLCIFVTAPFEGLLSRMREVGFKRPSHALANPVPLDLFMPPAKDEGFRSGVPTVMYTGRLAPEKNIDVTIRAVAALVPTFPDIQFIVTGHGVESEKLQALAKELQIEKNVRFTGFVNAEQLAALYQTADVFVMMSTAETQSLSLMQGYASGLPSVVARAHALPDFTPAECGFIVEPGAVSALAAKLKLLFEDVELRKKMGKAAVEYVHRFTPDKIAAEWEKVFADAITAYAAQKKGAHVKTES